MCHTLKSGHFVWLIFTVQLMGTSRNKVQQEYVFHCLLYIHTDTVMFSSHRCCVEAAWSHFLKSVTQCCPLSGRIVRSACHWLTHSFKILACLLLADTVVSCQSVSQLSHQPRPVHWTCSVAIHGSYNRQAQIFPHIS